MLRRTLIPLMLIAVSLGAQTRKTQLDVVPDERTAVRIAEAVLMARFGEGRVKTQMPLRAGSSPGDIWLVQGTTPGPTLPGGGMAVMIKKHTGCVVNILEHMK